jgi:broad specificity phosphatase PhoE
MTNTIHDVKVFARRLESLPNYRSMNRVHHHHLEPTILNERDDTNRKSPTYVDDSLHLLMRTNQRPKVISTKKKPLAHRLSSISQSRSPSIARAHHYNEHDSLRVHSRLEALSQVDACDLRFFIIRHGERVDRYFGPNWFLSAFDQLGQYRPFHVNLPPSLPTRSNLYAWAVDTPLTRDGLNAAQNVGRVLALNQFEPTYAYSSPAMRCVFTTYQILKGLGLENKLSIRIEPGLLELGAARFGMDIFLKPLDWHNYGIKVDLTYRPVMSTIPPVEREDAYYVRSKYIVRELERHHNHSLSSINNVLLVAHATSPETLTWDLVGRQPNVNDLYTLSLNIGYLQMVITERKRRNRSWSLKQMPLQSTTLKWV